MIEIVIASIFALIAAFFLTVGAMAWSGKLHGNSKVGLQVPEVRDSEEIWYKAHRVSGPWWVNAGLAFAFTAAFALKGFWVFTILGVVVAIGLVSVGSNLGARAANILESKEATKEAPAQVDLDAVRRAAGGQ
ncbi:SdpI family protein [Corynebacterium kozikiae]|uniref:SdpI family protein n=1 Tax=Corynebacterium kozikiae TaxID=2968469 RepID=UPI00211D0D66|nr:SdpI family protein [Corynebacterium sp. 76QC2CO]MCQ9343777.1 SdpI family protein [Corynebacterium sp. 76QC2CO]